MKCDLFSSQMHKHSVHLNVAKQILKNITPDNKNMHKMFNKMLTLKFSIVTARESSTSASMVSSSRSIRSIFSLICCRAASEHSAAKSAPTWPCVSEATCNMIPITKHVHIFNFNISRGEKIHHSILLWYSTGNTFQTCPVPPSKTSKCVDAESSCW